MALWTVVRRRWLFGADKRHASEWQQVGCPFMVHLNGDFFCRSWVLRFKRAESVRGKVDAGAFSRRIILQVALHWLTTLCTYLFNVNWIYSRSEEEMALKTRTKTRKRRDVSPNLIRVSFSHLRYCGRDHSVGVRSLTNRRLYDVLFVHQRSGTCTVLSWSRN